MLMFRPDPYHKFNLFQFNFQLFKMSKFNTKQLFFSLIFLEIYFQIFLDSLLNKDNYLSSQILINIINVNFEIIYEDTYSSFKLS